MDRPNIVLIVMDTARADSTLGKKEIMPNLQLIAKNSTKFTNAFTTGPWTLPSHSSLFTGLYTSDHGTHAGSPNFNPPVSTLPELLQESGYQTVAFSNNTWISPDFGFDRGFDDFITSWELFDDNVNLATIARENEGLNQVRSVIRNMSTRDSYKTLINALYGKVIQNRYDNGAFVTNLRIKNWFRNKEDSQRPFFMFINYLEPHLEYMPPKPYREKFSPSGVSSADMKNVNQDAWEFVAGERSMNEKDFQILRSLYHAELNYLDHRIGSLYNWLSDKNKLENTVFIITGDHGENIGEHGLMDHQYCLYDTLLHIPLIIQYPEEFQPGSVEDMLLELRDLYPTILSFADIDQNKINELPANDLTSLAGRNQVFAEYITPQPSMNSLETHVDNTSINIDSLNNSIRSVRTKSSKYIEYSNKANEFYDLNTDSAESNNILTDENRTGKKYKSLLNDKFGDLPTPCDTERQINSATEDRLEKLGYI
jgi:arylsulfatase A-like enzyme